MDTQTPPVAPLALAPCSAPTPAELMLLTRTAHLVSGKPIGTVSKQFADMLRAYVAERVAEAIEAKRLHCLAVFKAGWANDPK